MSVCERDRERSALGAALSREGKASALLPAPGVFAHLHKRGIPGWARNNAGDSNSLLRIKWVLQMKSFARGCDTGAIFEGRMQVNIKPSRRREWLGERQIRLVQRRVYKTDPELEVYTGLLNTTHFDTHSTELDSSCRPDAPKSADRSSST